MTNTKGSYRLVFLFVLLLTLLASCNRDTHTASSPIDKLLEGNNRYRSNHPVHPDQTRERLKELSGGQHPFAVVVSCSDSRVPPELVFDQGLGDLFVIRTAGHVVGDYELASIEYAVEHLRVSKVLVLGHENCGAVKALLEHPKGRLPGHLNNLVNYLRTESEEKELLSHGDHDLKHAVLANVAHCVNAVRNSKPILNEKVEQNELEVYGAYYSLKSGKVELIH